MNGFRTTDGSVMRLIPGFWNPTKQKKIYFIKDLSRTMRRFKSLIQINDFLLFVSIAFQILYGTGELANLFDPAVLLLPDLSHSRYPNQLYYQHAYHHFSLPFLGIYRVMSDWFLRNRRPSPLFRYY